jgi:hypothetical protein
MRFAQNTQVAADRSITEIKRTVERYGAESFIFGTNSTKEGDRGLVGFSLKGKSIRMVLKLPSVTEFMHTDKGRSRREPAARIVREQGVRQRWRALALVVKAKLEAVESGISTVEDEFLSFILVDEEHTVGEVLRDGMAKKYFGINAPHLLPAWSGMHVPAAEKADR